MSNFWDNWATKHRNWEVAAAAAAVLAILAWGIVQMGSAEVVGSTEVTAVVTEIRGFGAASAGSPQDADANTEPGAGREFGVGVLTLEDGSTIQMLLVKPFPQPGDRLPLLIEHYDDGSKTYTIDRVKLQTQESE